MKHWLNGRMILAFLTGICCAVLLLFALGLRQPAEAKGGRLYIVQKIYWQYDDRSVPFHESEPDGAGWPHKVFADREVAEAFSRDLNLEARAEHGNPFAHGRGWGHSFPSLSAYTSMPTGEFIAWLEAEGIPPPAGQKEAWLALQQVPKAYRRFDQSSYDAWWSWWQGSAGRSEEQRHRIWEKLDRVRFFEVVEVES